MGVRNRRSGANQMKGPKAVSTEKAVDVNPREELV